MPDTQAARGVGGRTLRIPQVSMNGPFSMTLPIQKNQRDQKRERKEKACDIDERAAENQNDIFHFRKVSSVKPEVDAAGYGRRK